MERSDDIGDEPLQPCAGRLPQEKRTNQDRERNQMPAKTCKNAESDDGGDRQVDCQKPLP